MLLFKDTRSPDRTKETVREDERLNPGGPRIRCPRCAWEPRRHDRWQCSCRHEWNTFDTAGRCPSCGRQWLETRCPSCHEWSPHLEWYEGYDGDGDR